MTDQRAQADDQAPEPRAGADPGGQGTPAGRGRTRGRWSRVMWGLGTGLAGLVLVSAVGLGAAEYYTTRPSFCGTCHVMEPYYASWGHDLHGARLGVLCVDCHYAPGERFTFKAKFKGLSQVASYFSGRYGAARPRAHVADASCLRSTCHGDGAFMDKPLPIGQPRTETRILAGVPTEVHRLPTVTFYHRKHLDVSDRLHQAETQLSQAAEHLRTTVGEEAFGRIQVIAAAVDHVEQRRARLEKLAAELGLSAAVYEKATELMDLEHRRVRLRQLEGITCAACHVFDASGSHHLTVNQQTCFTCHFNQEQFNQRTGTCLKCHEPPRRAVPVHGDAVSGQARPVLMDHAEMVERGVDCISCHFDVVRGQGQVSARECARCHDQARYLSDFETRTTQIVEEYHRVHVAAQRAHCEDCHHVIQHSLLPPAAGPDEAGFLEPVINDCQHCHPAHHREQVQLLRGLGGAGVERPVPNAMFGSRVNCRGCHTQPGEDFKGDRLVQATEQSCRACHTDDYALLFQQWQAELGASLSEAEKAIDAAASRLADLRTRGAAVPSRAEELLEAARHNLRLVKSANGIHNKHYALQLLDASVRCSEQVRELLGPPQ